MNTKGRTCYPNAPLPYWLIYFTWLEHGSFDIQGRLANWFVYPVCTALEKIMQVWPHKHNFYVGPDSPDSLCLFCNRYEKSCSRYF